jgi:hypothetical protein
VLELASFRDGAARYVTVELSPEWGRTEQRLRNSAARSLYQRAAASNAAKRPKRAWREWLEAERFVQPYRDAAALAEKARQKALTRVAIVPFACDDPTLGRDVATAWRDEIGQRMAPPTASFTRILGAEAVESAVSLAQLGRLTRAEALRAGRDAAPGGVYVGDGTSTRLEIFKDHVSRRIVQKDTDGTRRVFWIDVPIEVVARTRVVTVKVDCEVVSARGGASLAHRVIERSTSARVVWTSHSPEGDIDTYSLVSDEVRAADPARTKQVESRWKAVCGNETTLQQVLSARRSTRGSGQYDRGALPRFIEGAAFVMLSELPPANDPRWPPSRTAGSRCIGARGVDEVDDVDLDCPPHRPARAEAPQETGRVRGVQSRPSDATAAANPDRTRQSRTVNRAASPRAAEGEPAPARFRERLAAGPARKKSAPRSSTSARRGRSPRHERRRGPVPGPRPPRRAARRSARTRRNAKDSAQVQRGPGQRGAACPSRLSPAPLAAARLRDILRAPGAARRARRPTVHRPRACVRRARAPRRRAAPARRRQCRGRGG